MKTNAPAPEGLEALQTDIGSVSHDKGHHHAWILKLSRMDALRVFVPDGADVDEIERLAMLNFPQRSIEYARPVEARHHERDAS